MFDNWTANQRLVDCRRLTNKTGAYLLLGPRARNEWKEWSRARAEVVSSVDYSLKGLPAGFILLWVTGLDKLLPRQMVGMPGFEGGAVQQPRTIWISGGTKVRGASSRGVYAEYDPPTANLQGPADFSITADGAELAPISEGKPPESLPGEKLRTYALKIQLGSSVVILTARAPNGQVVQEISFAIEDTTVRIGNVEAREACQSVDKFGELTSGAGIKGASAPTHGSNWEFGDRRVDAGEAPTPALFDHVAFRLLDSMHLAGKRITIQEFSQRALRITGIEQWRLYTEIRWLHSLAHIDLQIDDRGRWSHIHPVPRQAYLLPWLNAGRYQAVVTGCGPLEHMRRLASSLRDAGFAVAARASKAILVPPRVIVMHKDKGKLQAAVQQQGVQWIGYPSAEAIANWSCSLGEWLCSTNLRWLDQEAPKDLPEYVPALFRMTRDRANLAPSRLFWMLDPYSQRHYWHVLERQSPPNENDRQIRHSYIRDPAWAKWKTHLAIADEKTLVPFLTRDSSVPIPKPLQLPLLIARALCLCSGLPPTQVRFCPAYADSKVGVLPKESSRYEGECWVYCDVPRTIADKVAQKLGGELKDV